MSSYTRSPPVQGVFCKQDAGFSAEHAFFRRIDFSQADGASGGHAAVSRLNKISCRCQWANRGDFSAGDRERINIQHGPLVDDL
jgi:hypothetical protein